ncbi:MAG: AAA family ATPase [Deinococcales bacterium]
MEALDINLWEAEKRSQIEALQWQLGQRLLTLGQTVVIEWGTWAREERERLRVGARALNATTELHYLSAPPETLFERIQKRAREKPPITLANLREWAQTFEVPTSEEMALYDRSIELKV